MIKTQKQKIESLQALRAFAFLSVFAFHSGFWSFGFLGVSAFFVLSGFLMTILHYDSMGSEMLSLKESIFFSIRRIKRLYPLHIITMLIASAYMIFDKYINNCMNRDFLMHIVKCMIFTIPLLQTWIPKMYVAFSLNGPSWYLSVSLFLYAAFPALLYLLKRKLTVKNAIPMLLSVFTIQTLLFVTAGRMTPSEQYTNEWSKWFSYIFPISRLGDFTIGCIAGFLFLNRKNKQNKYSATLLELFTVIIVLISSNVFSRLDNGKYEWFRYTTLLLPGALMLVWVFAVNDGIITRILTNRFTIWIGNISPYAFLIHQIVICWFNYLLRLCFGDVDSWILAIINLAITLFLSDITYKIINKKAKQ